MTTVLLSPVNVETVCDFCGMLIKRNDKRFDVWGHGTMCGECYNELHMYHHNQEEEYEK